MQLLNWESNALSKLLTFLSFHELVVVGIDCRKLFPTCCHKSSEDQQN